MYSSIFIGCEPPPYKLCPTALVEGWRQGDSRDAEVQIQDEKKSVRCRANLAHTRQSQPDSGLGFLVKSRPKSGLGFQVKSRQDSGLGLHAKVLSRSLLARKRT